MKKTLAHFFGWSFLVALIVHLLFVWSLPSLIMMVVGRRLGKLAPNGRAYHAPIIDEKARTVVMPSPDLLYTVCTFDVSQKALQVRAHVPKSYWSLAMYDDATNNFYVINDQQAGPGQREWRLIGPRAKAKARSGVRLVRSPTSKGIILVRMLLRDRKDASKLQKLQRNASCTSLSQP